MTEIRQSKVVRRRQLKLQTINIGVLPATSPLIGYQVAVQATSTPRQTTMIVRNRGPLIDPHWDAHPVGFEELLLAYMADSEPAVARPLRAVG